MRPHLIAALAQDVKSVSDEHPNVMSAGLRLLIDMCGEWRKTIQEGADPDDGGADKQGAPSLLNRIQAACRWGVT